MRGRDLGPFTKYVSPLRHVMLVAFSVIGIIGAVLQIVAINKLDFKLFDTAKSLRIASGSLFIFISTWVILAPVGLVILCGDRLKCSTQNVVLPATLVILCGCALMLESVYRVLAATKIDGFILETYSVGVILVLPELLVIVIFIAFNFEDMGHVALYDVRMNSQESLETSKTVSNAETSRSASEV